MVNIFGQEREEAEDLLVPPPPLHLPGPCLLMRPWCPTSVPSQMLWLLITLNYGSLWRQIASP